MVVLALAALLVGPALALFWARGRAWRAVIDGLSLALVGGICFLVVFPHAIEVAGPIGILAAIPGILTPGWIHRFATRWERTFTYAGLALLAFHAAIDGAALTVPGTSMGVAVVAHRLPMGLAVYSAARRASSSPNAGVVAVGTLLAATLVGVAIGEPMSALGGPIGHGAFEGFVGGLLLHIVFEHAPVFPAPEQPDLLGHGHHQGGHDHGHQHHQISARLAARAGGNRWSAFGALLGLFLVGGLLWSQGQDPAGHDEHAHHASALFTNTLWELTLATAPVLLLGYAGAAVWTLLIPPSPTPPNLGASTLRQATSGVLLGVREQPCAYGVVPRAEAHLHQGTSVRLTIAFLVATPALSISGLVVSAGLLGGPLTVTRIVAAIALALLAALIVRRTRRLPQSDSPSAPPAHGGRTGWPKAMGFGFGELVDHTLPWVAISILTAGLGVVALPALAPDQWSAFLQVPILAVLGVPLYVCATGATPAAATLVEHGLSSGAAMAVLVAGPALNLPAIALMRTHLGKRPTRRIVTLVLATAVTIGWAVDALQWHPPELATRTSSGIVSWICLGVLVLMAVRSLVRQGSRGVLAQIMEPIEIRQDKAGAGGDTDDHAPGHGHGHGHGHAASSTDESSEDSCA